MPTFVILDLETTGLSTEKDAIIEIAAIKCEIWKENGIWIIKNKEERSMLVNPEREITEEISLITHITNDMVIWHPLWWEIREKVRDFIGDNIVVGHNVLFDVSMLKTHGIDISKNTILDTFEMSELIAHESESLNLGFLGKKYGFTTTKWEHRALGDVEICLSLFIHFLERFESLDDTSMSILRSIAEIEEKQNISCLLNLINQENWPLFSLVTLKKSFPENKLKEKTKHEKKEFFPVQKVLSFSGNKDEEMCIYNNLAKTNKTLHIIASDFQKAKAYELLLSEAGYSVCLFGWKREYYSTKYIEEIFRENAPLNRKLAILIVRILFWVRRTDTWRMNELKFYWDEYLYKDLFVLEQDESNYFYEKQKDFEKNVSIVISASLDLLTESSEKPEWLMVSEIGFLSEKVSKHLCYTIDVKKAFSILENYKDLPGRESIIQGLSLISHIYESTPKRPSWTEEYPPWEYGETYFYDQETLWLKWWKWLILGTQAIESGYSLLREYPLSSWVIETKERRYLEDTLSFLIDYHQYTSSRKSIVIEISHDSTILRFIPRDVSHFTRNFIERGATKTLTTFWYGINGTRVASFLKREWLLFWILEEQEITPFSALIVKNDIKDIDDLCWSVILTTNLKHVRELGHICKSLGYEVLMQWISGWKAKIQSIWHWGKHETILIWLLDSWKSEYTLWPHAKNIILAKLPFDPPSDPYFLARTVGMSNNFALYSEPMVIQKINSLIWYAKREWFVWTIYTLDSRLKTSSWWWWVYKELL